jgi:hypothetical protein
MTESGIKELGGSTVSEFDRRVATLDPDVSWRFHDEAKRLEIELLTVYRAAALSVRELDDLGEIARVWGIMVSVCDEAAVRLNKLVTNHPSAGAEIYYDRVLDLRNKCRRLQNLHE